MKKRLISLIMVLALLSSYTTAFATDFTNDRDLYEEIVMQEDKIIVSKNTNDTVFAATITPAGRMIAVIKSSETLKQYIFNEISTNIYQEVCDSLLSVEALMEYCTEYEAEADVKIYGVQEINSTSKPRGTGSMYFTQQLRSIYGAPYSDRLLKTDTTTYPGYTMEVRGMLTTSVNLLSDYEYEKGMALLILAVNIAGFCGWSPAGVMAVMVDALAIYDILDTVNEIFIKDGTLSAFLLTATQHRYVNINGHGPYSEIVKLTEYLGLDDTNPDVDPTMEQMTVMYTPDNSALFTDSTYRKLIKAAYENYTG